MREKSVNASLVIEIVAPLVIRRPMPRKAYIVASVMMNGGRPICTTPNAWNRPMPTPISERNRDGAGDRGGEAEIVGQQQGDNHADEAFDRADGEIDAAGDDDEGLDRSPGSR